MAVPYTSTMRGGEAVLCLGDNAFSVELAFSAAPSTDVANANLGTFLSYVVPSKVTAESNVLAMHGNMYYPDALTVPMAQRNNYVYLLDDSKITSGGFSVPYDPAGFVGKS